jgi:hypothetical protein
VVYDIDDVDRWAESHEYGWVAYHGHHGWAAHHWRHTMGTMDGRHTMGRLTAPIANSGIYCVVGSRISGI